MVRAPCVDKNGMKKGAWSEDEDDKLRSYIQRYGHWNWRELPKFAGLSRCGKSCRLRWMNYLRPNVKRGNYTKDEEDLIIKFHQLLGNKWSAIAAKLPGRSDNEIKNHWHTHLKKRASRNQVISEDEEEQQQQQQQQQQQSSKQEIVSEEQQNSYLVSDEQQQSSKHSNTLVVVSEEEQSSNQRIIDFSTGEIGPDMFLSSGSGNRVIDQSSSSSSMLEDGGLDLRLSLCLNYG